MFFIVNCKKGIINQGINSSLYKRINNINNMKKIGLILMSMLLTVVFFQSCTDDLEDFADPRDAITKEWQATITDVNGIESFPKVSIAKDPQETTKVIFTNFHELASVTSDQVYATLAGNTLTIPSQTLGGEYTIVGSGVISDNLLEIVFEYTVDDGGGPEEFDAIFGSVVTAKKKLLTASLSE